MWGLGFGVEGLGFRLLFLGQSHITDRGTAAAARCRLAPPCGPGARCRSPPG